MRAVVTFSVSMSITTLVLYQQIQIFYFSTHCGHTQSLRLEQDDDMLIIVNDVIVGVKVSDVIVGIN